MSYDASKSRWSKRIEHYGERGFSEGRRMLFCGEYGAGKTTLCGTAPAPLFLDADYGENKDLRRGAHPVLYIGIDHPYSDLKGIIEDMIAKRDIFDPDGGPMADRLSLALDSWTKINEFLLFEICQEDHVNLETKKPEWDQFFKLKSRQQILGRLLKDLALKRGVNILATALVVTEGDEAEKMTKKPQEASAKAGFNHVVSMPNLTGAYRKIIGAEFEEVYYLECAQGAQPIYRAYTSPKSNFRTKSRFSIQETITDPTFDKIITLAKKVS